MVVPHDLGKTKICDLDLPDATSTDTLDEFALFDLILISRLLWLRILRRNERYRAEKYVFWLDVTVGNVSKCKPRELNMPCLRRECRI